MDRARSRLSWAAMVLGALNLGASCGQSALGILPGVVNDPGNLTLRRDILQFGTDRMCAEMSKRSMPLRLRPEDPAIGRFFTTRCNVKAAEAGHLRVEFAGFGYVWTNLTGRLTFESSGSIGYDTDFLMDGATMYVYFRATPPPEATFTTRVVERPQVSLLLTGLPLFGSGGQGLGDVVGAAIVRGEIGKGFTVVRDTNGSAEFGLGVVERGEHGARAPFRVEAGGKTIVANDRTELHKDQRDFVGPIEVHEGGRLVVDVLVDGAPAADVLLVPRGQGEVWLQQYALQAAPTPPPGQPMLDEAVAGGIVWKRTLTPPAGLYYLVLDNTGTAGRTAPSGAGDDRAALVSYGIAVDP